MSMQNMFYVVNTTEIEKLLTSAGFKPFSKYTFERKYLCINYNKVLGNTAYSTVCTTPELTYEQLKQIVSMKVLLPESDWIEFTENFTKDLPVYRIENE